MSGNDPKRSNWYSRPAVSSIRWGLYFATVPLVALVLHLAFGLRAPVMDLLLAPAELFSFFFVLGDNARSRTHAYLAGLPFCLAFYLFVGWAVGICASWRWRRRT